MNCDLLFMWEAINVDFFGGKLAAPSDIDWHELTGDENSLEAFALYLPFHNAIAIDERFRYDRALASSGDVVEGAKVELVCNLITHEMIHQAQYQFKLDGKGRHGKSFIEVATPIASAMGVTPPDESTASRWPDILHLLAIHSL